MLIKHQALDSHLKHSFSPIYILIGPDSYLMMESIQHIKNHWKARKESETTYLTINQPTDWATLIEEANSYSLFSDVTLIDASFDKKTLDVAGKNALLNYAKTNNERSLILIRAPLLTPKSLQALSSIAQITIVQVVSLQAPAMHQWITQELHKAGFVVSAEIVNLIQQYTTGNHLACAQVIMKLTLIHQPGDTLTRDDVLVNLTDQCAYQLYELADACLAGDVAKAIHLIRTANEDRTEVTLILWLLTQEIRLLIQLHHKLSHNIPINQACTQLKIWPQRTRLYQTTLKRLSPSTLTTLLRMSQQLDEGFKTGKNKHIWQSIEQLIMKLSENLSIA